VTIRCPDCQRVFRTRSGFVSHRKARHPPRTLRVQGAGAIASQERVGSPGGGR
jgi:uncharacterized C2H2 Zn-finger protein